MRFLVALGLVAVSTAASAQIPDMKLHLDAIASYRDASLRNTQLRYYSAFGQFSTVTLEFQLEPGFTAYLSQKLERIPHDPDTSSLDQAYVEDEGIWRIGKQYLPFGTGNILKESIPAARADSQLVIEEIPIRFAVCDAGERKQRGGVVRFGHNMGFSVAVGEHFGINGTALTQIRRPDELIPGQGYRQAFGADATLATKAFSVTGEAVLLRKGHTVQDTDRSVLDIAASFRQRSFLLLTFGYTREDAQKLDILRAVAEVSLNDNLSARPFVRAKNGRLWDVGIELRVRL